MVILNSLQILLIETWLVEMLSLEITIFSVFFLHNKTQRTAVFIWDNFNSNYVILFKFHPVLSSFIIHLLELYNYKAFRTLRAYPLF